MMKPCSILKLMADETRLRMLVVLTQRPLCVGELETVLKISQSNASRHLAKLLSYGLVATRRESRCIHYRLNDAPDCLPPPLRLFLSSLREEEDFKADLEALAALEEKDIPPIRAAKKTWLFSEDDLI